jgi:hypothetical protein
MKSKKWDWTKVEEALPEYEITENGISWVSVLMVVAGFVYAGTYQDGEFMICGTPVFGVDKWSYFPEA